MTLLKIYKSFWGTTIKELRSIDDFPIEGSENSKDRCQYLLDRYGVCYLSDDTVSDSQSLIIELLSTFGPFDDETLSFFRAQSVEYAKHVISRSYMLAFDRECKTPLDIPYPKIGVPHIIERVSNLYGSTRIAESIEDIPKDMREDYEEIIETYGICYIVDDELYSIVGLIGLVSILLDTGHLIYDYDFCIGFAHYYIQFIQDFTNMLAEEDDDTSLEIEAFDVDMLVNQEYKNAKRKWADKTDIISSIDGKILTNTPKELVRYAWEQFLLKTVLQDFPTGDLLLESEVPISHFGVSKDSYCIDSILYKKGQNDIREPFILFEFKEKEVDLDDEIKFHLDHYHSLLKEKGFIANYLIISNGYKHLIRNTEQENYEELAYLPPYKNLLDNIGVVSQAVPNSIIPTEFDSIDNSPDSSFKLDIYNDFYTDKSNVLLYFIATNLAELEQAFFNSTKHSEDEESPYFSFKKAESVAHFHYFLRYYKQTHQEILDFKQDDNPTILKIGGISKQILSGQGISDHETTYMRLFSYKNQTITICISPWMGVKQPHLLVSIGQIHRLQLNLLKYLSIDENRMVTLTYDGLINLNGGLTKQKVLAYVQEKLPHLIKNNEILFGSFKMKKGVSMKDFDFKQTIINLLEYALLWENLKEE